MSDTRRTVPSPDGTESVGYLLLVRAEAGSERDVDLPALLRFVFSAWRLLLAAAFVGAGSAALIVLQLPSVYRAEAVLAPASRPAAGGLGAVGGQMSGLAALAGIDLGVAGDTHNEALAALSSPGFVRDFIETGNLLPLLYPDKWDAASAVWKVGDAPSLEEAVLKFEKHRRVREDRRTGLVTLTIDWYEPEQSAAWVNGQVQFLNDRLREDARQQAARSIEFLNEELSRTSVVGLQQAIHRLIETQVNNAMIANVQREYAFKVIDRARASRIRVAPSRIGWIAIGAMLGLLLVATWRSVVYLRPPAAT